MDTPQRLIRRAELYEQWSTLLGAGVPMLRSLATLRRTAFARGYRSLLDRVTDRLENGASLPDALEPEHRSIPRFDVALLRAGDRSGRLDACLKDLAHQYRLRAKWLSQSFNACAYPLLLLTVSLLVFPVHLIVTISTEGDWMPFLIQKAQVFGTVCVGLLILTLLVAVTRKLPWIQALAERLISMVPILGKALHERALARLILALDALLNSGIGVVDAWPAAGDASGSIRLRTEVENWHANLSAGRQVSEVLVPSRLFPDLFKEAYQVGETSGKMEDTLHRLLHHYEESSANKMEQLAIWVPRILYFAVLIYVAMSVLEFWQGYWDQIDGLLR